jgi:hypothetical protein
MRLEEEPTRSKGVNSLKQVQPCIHSQAAALTSSTRVAEFLV